MNRSRDWQQFGIMRAVLADAIVREVLSEDGNAVRCTYHTLLAGRVPTEITLSLFLPASPSGSTPPEAYLDFILWPDEPRPRPHGRFNVAFRGDRGWMLYGDFDYRGTRTHSADLERLIEGERHQC